MCTWCSYITQSKYALEHLNINTRTHNRYSNDTFGTDDHIGYVDIPLESLRLPPGSSIQRKRSSAESFKFGSSKSLKSRRRARKAKSTELASLHSLLAEQSDEDEEEEEDVHVDTSEENGNTRNRAQSTPQSESIRVSSDHRTNRSDTDVLFRRTHSHKTPQAAKMRFSPTSKTPDVTSSSSQSMLNDTERVVISTTKWFDLICVNDATGRSRSDSDLIIKEEGDKHVKCGKIKIEIRLLMT